MGFIEETGARSTIATRASSRSTKGTTGIQANDLIGRKTARDGGVDGACRCRRISIARRRVLLHIATRRCVRSDCGWPRATAALAVGD
jgi:hypothetical protein